jgi:hypothetical protein
MALTTRRTDPIYAGETWQEDVQLKDERGAPLDLTGASVRVDLFYPNTDRPALSAEIGSGVTLTDPANGVVTWVFDSARTASLCPGVYTARVTLTRSGVVTVAINYRLPILETIQ